MDEQTAGARQKATLWWVSWARQRGWEATSMLIQWLGVDAAPRLPGLNSRDRESRSWREFALETVCKEGEPLSVPVSLSSAQVLG